MILFECQVTSGPLLTSDMRPDNDLFLNPLSLAFHCTVSLCMSQLCLASDDQTQSEHVPALTEVN